MAYYTLEQAENRANEMIKSIQAALDLANKLPVCDFAQYYIAEEVVAVHLPFNWKLYRQYRKLLGNDWKTGDTWTTTQHEDYISKHKNFIPADSEAKSWLYADVYLKICLDTNLVNSLCHIEQIGIKEMPVYEVKCE